MLQNLNHCNIWLEYRMINDWNIEKGTRICECLRFLLCKRYIVAHKIFNVESL